MARLTYIEKLKDPRWQKKRLEILDSNNWTCQYCSNKNLSLNVHHLCYNNETRNPWDVDNSALIVLCEHCHKISHLKNLTDLEKDIISEVYNVGMVFCNSNEVINNFIKRINEIVIKYKL